MAGGARTSEASRFTAGVFAASACAFVALASWTPTDIDEGYYAVAGELVGKGRHLYRDFFYPQAPLFPYVLAALNRLVHPSFLVERATVALAGAAMATVIASAVRRETGSKVGASIAVLLFMTHELAWQWVPCLKAYGLATLLGLSAVVLVSRVQAPRLRDCALAGVLAAAAIGMRLLLAPVVVAAGAAAALRGARFPVARAAVVWWVGRWALSTPTLGRFVLAGAVSAVVLLSRRQPWVPLLRILAVAAGVALVLAPLYWFYRGAPDAFLFSNLGYHAHRATGGLFAGEPTNRSLARELIGLETGDELSAAGVQFVLLYVLNAAAFFFPRRELRLGPWLAASFLATANLLPNPSHEQYFVVLVPFLAVGAGVTAAHLLRFRIRRRRNALVLVLVAAYVLLAIPSFKQRSINAKYGDWRLANFRPFLVDDAAREVRRAARAVPGPILAAWPGSALGTADRLLPGYENHFLREVAGSLTPEVRTFLHAPTNDDMLVSIARREPAIVVIDRVVHEGDLGKRMRAEALAAGYQPFGNIVGVTEVWVRPQPGPPGVGRR